MAVNTFIDFGQLDTVMRVYDSSTPEVKQFMHKKTHMWKEQTL